MHQNLRSEFPVFDSFADLKSNLVVFVRELSLDIRQMRVGGIDILSFGIPRGVSLEYKEERWLTAVCERFEDLRAKYPKACRKLEP